MLPVSVTLSEPEPALMVAPLVRAPLAEMFTTLLPAPRSSKAPSTPEATPAMVTLSTPDPPKTIVAVPAVVPPLRPYVPDLEASPFMAREFVPLPQINVGGFPHADLVVRSQRNGEVVRTCAEAEPLPGDDAGGIGGLLRKNHVMRTVAKIYTLGGCDVVLVIPAECRHKKLLCFHCGVTSCPEPDPWSVRKGRRQAFTAPALAR